MKTLVLYISLLLLQTTTMAQKNDSVDIRGMVQKQIQEAQKKQKAELISVDNKNYKSTPIIKKSSKQTLEQIEVISWMTTEIIILLSASIAAVIFIVIRRRRLRKSSSNRDLKKNIKIIREEQLVINIDPRLRSIRKRLCLNSFYLNNVGNDVSAAARRLQIAKGEILLASRIRSYEIEKNLEGQLK